MKKGLLFALFAAGMLAVNAQVQVDQAKLLVGFDEQAAMEHMKKKGIPASEYPSYMKHLKAKYIAEKNPAADPRNVSYDAKTKTININLQTYMNPSCDNLDFGNTSFNNWSGGTYVLSGSSWPSTPLPFGTALANTGNNTAANTFGSQHSLMTVVGTAATNPAGGPWGPTTGWDENALAKVGNQVFSDLTTVAPNGSGVSVRLGNSTSGAKAQNLKYTLNPVNAQNAQFTFMFAVVLEDPSHGATNQPFFSVKVYDANGNQIPGACGQYNVDAMQAASDPNFSEAWNSTGTFQTSIFYRKWTTNSLNLSGYAPGPVTVEFISADCAWGGHFGYAYVDAFCGPLQLSVSGVCPGSPQAILNAPPGFATYQWYGPNTYTPIGGATNDTLVVAPVPATGTTYTVEMTTNGGCQSSAIVTIQPSTVTVSSALVLPSCAGGTTGAATLTPSGAQPGTTYTFSVINSSGSTIYSGTNTAVSPLAAGTYTVSVASGGCPNRDTTFTVPNTPITPSNHTVVFCSSPTSISANSTTMPGTNTNWQWYDPTGNAIAGANSNSTIITGATNGQVYSVTSVNSTGCRDSQLVTLNFQGPTFLSSAYPTCGGGNSGQAIITHVQSSTNVNPYTWTFTGPVSGSGGPTNIGPTGSFTLDLLPAGTYSYTVFDNSTPACSYSGTFTVNAGGIPVTQGGPIYKCSNDNITINGGIAGSVHQWYYTPSGNPPVITLPGQTSQNINVTGSTAGWYVDTVLITNSNGAQCKSVYMVKYVDTTLAIAHIRGNNPCYHDSVGNINVQMLYGPYIGPYNYSFGPQSSIWAGCPTNSFPMTGNINVGGSQNFTNLCAGTYTIQLTLNGCVLKDTFDIIEASPLPPDTLKAVYCSGDTLGTIYKYPVNPVSNSYQWYQSGNILPGANDTILYIVDPENTYNQYTATFMLYGCKHYATKYVYEKPPPLFIPEHTVNVFSPNGDNINETFHPFRIDPSYNNPIGGTNLEQKAIDYFADEYSLIIFDRWGKKIYESSDYATAWDGKLKSGRKADDGTYFYVATYRSRCGDDADKVTKQGFIHLLK